MAKHHTEPDSPETRPKSDRHPSIITVSLRSVEIIEGLPQFKVE